MLPHQSQVLEKRFLISIAITTLVLLAESVGGFWTGSLALLSDAAHVFMDVFALALSYIAIKLSALPPDDRHSYGYHRLEVLAALANGISLGAISVGIFVEAYHRWFTPEAIKSREMLIIATIGLVANILVAFVLYKNGSAHEHGHVEERDLNRESAFLHVIGDAGSSVAVIVAGVVILVTGWAWVDPLVSALIGIVILISSVRVLRSSLHILIEGTPEGLSLTRIDQALKGIPGVAGVHDLHVWNICSGRVALSAHLVMDNTRTRDTSATMADVKQVLWQLYGIEHTTVQLEQVACGQGYSAERQY